MDRHEVGLLAGYNGEQSRGLVHTPEWQAKMADLQARFDAESRADPTGGAYRRRSWLERFRGWSP